MPSFKELEPGWNEMTKKTKIIVGVAVFLVIAICDFWHGYHQSRSIPVGVFSLIGGILSGIFFGGWPGPKERPDKHDSSGTLV
jgi:hypothetical protein